jgi:hypothetical protein
MRSDSYQTFIKTLNTSEPYPPFQEIRDLVMQQNGRRKAAFAPFYKYAAVAVLFAALGLFAGSHFLVNDRLPNTRMTHPSQVTHASHVTDGLTLTNGALNNKTIASQKGMAQHLSRKQFPTTPALATVNQVNIPATNATSQHSTMGAATPPSNANAVQAIVTSTVAPSVWTTLAQISDQKERANNWSGFISGGSIVSSNSFSANSIFGAAGVRYLVSGSSSLAVELRRSSFVVNHAAQSGGFHDTTFSLGGRSYTNTIGDPSQPATTSTSPINSLDLGYRFDLNPNNVLSPCAEILAGASTSGFLSSEAAGIEYRFANSLSLDVSARAEQLFSSQSNPLTALGFEAGIGFEW